MLLSPILHYITIIYIYQPENPSPPSFFWQVLPYYAKIDIRLERLRGTIGLFGSVALFYVALARKSTSYVGGLKFCAANIFESDEMSTTIVPLDLQISASAFSGYRFCLSQIKLRKNLFPQEMNFCIFYRCTHALFNTANDEKNFFPEEKHFLPNRP